MSKSIKEIIVKFFALFIIINILGALIKVAHMNIEKAFVLALGISTGDLILYLIKKNTKTKKIS